MKETLSSTEIFEICIALARKLQGLDASLALRVKEALEDPNLVENLLENTKKSSVYATVCETLKPLVGDEVLKGSDFIKRSQALVSQSGKRALDEDDYESLKMEENPDLLPGLGDKIIVFLGTEFEDGGRIFILALRCDGEIWTEAYFDLDVEFDRRFEVAVSGVSSLAVIR